MGIHNRPSIAYYVSAHGYGHGVRSCDIIRAFNRLFPDIRVHVITTLPAGFLHNRIPGKQNRFRSGAFDIGMVQKDSIRVDVPATLKQLERLYAGSEILIKEESGLLSENNVKLVVVDIPAIPIEAAHRNGIPVMAIGNFGWDWIYSDFLNRDSGWQCIVERIRDSYSKSNLLLRLPFSEEMKAFPVVEDIPIVASAGVDRRAEIAELIHCDINKKWILFSFTALQWEEKALDRVENLQDYEFITVLPLNWKRSNIHAIHREQVPFSDIVASVDAVISKPGFGILSDCVVNRKPLIYADRTDFAEYSVLETAITKYLKNRHIPFGDLYRGNLLNSLERIWDSPDPVESIRSGGDRIAAERIAGLAGIS